MQTEPGKRGQKRPDLTMGRASAFGRETLRSEGGGEAGKRGRHSFSARCPLRAPRSPLSVTISANLPNNRRKPFPLPAGEGPGPQGAGLAFAPAWSAGVWGPLSCDKLAGARELGEGGVSFGFCGNC